MANGTAHVAAEDAPTSPGSRVAAVVRATGARAAGLVEGLGRVQAAALGSTVQNVANVWADVVGVSIDVVVSAIQPRHRHPARPDAPGARRCIDLTNVRTGEQIDRALSEGLVAARPPRRDVSSERVPAG
jgi:hypothetical protein